MSRQNLTVLIAAGALWVAGCERSDVPSIPPATNPTGTQPALTEDQRKINAGLAAQSELVRASRARYERELNEELERAERLLAAWRSRLAEAEPAARARIEHQIEVLTAQAEVGRKKLEELRKVGEEAYFDFRKTIDPVLEGFHRVMGAPRGLNVPETLPAELTTLPQPATRYFELPTATQRAEAPTTAPVPGPR